MDRLARLAGAPGLRAQLLVALTALETKADFQQLPALFAALPGEDNAVELAYLADALETSTEAAGPMPA